MNPTNKNLTLVIFSIIVLVLLAIFPAPADRILNIQNYLITVGGIISAFVIAYLSSKIFNVRNERAIRHNEIQNYSDKLTLFRRLLFYVMRNDSFWVFHSDIEKFKRKYPGITFHALHAQDGNELVDNFWLNEKEISNSTIDLYLAMESIANLPEPEGNFFPSWHVDRVISFDYTTDDLIRYFNPTNQIWYYLDGRFQKHGKGRFNDNFTWILFESHVTDILGRLGSQYRAQEFNRKILAEIAGEFYSFYLPKLLQLTRQNIGIPHTLIRTFRSLLLIMSFGVLLPIIIQSLSLSVCLNIILTLSFVWVTSICLLAFMIDFYNFLTDDIHLTYNRS